MRGICKIHQPVGRESSAGSTANKLPPRSRDGRVLILCHNGCLPSDEDGKSRTVLIYCGSIAGREKAEVLISLGAIRSDLFCLALAVDFAGSGAFSDGYFFPATVRQVASPAQASSFLLRKPGQPPSDNSLDSPGL